MSVWTSSSSLWNLLLAPNGVGVGDGVVDDDALSSAWDSFHCDDVVCCGVHLCTPSPCLLRIRLSTNPSSYPVVVAVARVVVAREAAVDVSGAASKTAARSHFPRNSPTTPCRPIRVRSTGVSGSWGNACPSPWNRNISPVAVEDAVGGGNTDAVVVVAAAAAASSVCIGRSTGDAANCGVIRWRTPDQPPGSKKRSVAAAARVVALSAATAAEAAAAVEIGCVPRRSDPDCWAI